ncbi:pro-melanin-concentrating hormone, like [Engraulis encrasicolus]|uniref:pro-melanin-concentrating hormone, like n=1 Tax=Engraulis encrasicolus TaxID=184585 RepID=UPI002FD790CF
MKTSVSTVLLVLAVLCEYHLRPSLASPAAAATSWLGDSEQDVLTQLLSDDTAGASEAGVRDAVVPPPPPPPAARVIVVGDASLWGALRALERGALPLPLPLHHQQLLSEALERREAPGGQEQPHPNFSVLRRDAMRCMVGRVYRPCWEV